MEWTIYQKEKKAFYLHSQEEKWKDSYVSEAQVLLNGLLNFTMGGRISPIYFRNMKKKRCPHPKKTLEFKKGRVVVILEKRRCLDILWLGERPSGSMDIRAPEKVSIS